jgi:hypothetical protein
MQRKLYVVCEVDASSGNGRGGSSVDDILQELGQMPGLSVLSHQVAEGNERSILIQKPYAIFLAASQAQ